MPITNYPQIFSDFMDMAEEIRAANEQGDTRKVESIANRLLQVATFARKMAQQAEDIDRQQGAA